MISKCPFWGVNSKFLGWWQPMDLHRSLLQIFKLHSHFFCYILRRYFANHLFFFCSFYLLLHVPKINATFWVFCRSDGSDLASWMMQIHILKSNPCFSPDVLNSMETTKETTKNGVASQEDYSSGFIGTGPLECPLETSCWFDCWPFWGDPTPTFST